MRAWIRPVTAAALVIGLAGAVPATASAAGDTAFLSWVRVSDTANLEQFSSADSTPLRTATSSTSGSGLDLVLRNTATSAQTSGVKVSPAAGTTFTAGASVPVSGSAATAGSGSLTVFAACSGTVTGTVSVASATYASGALASLDATFSGTCAGFGGGQKVSGDIVWNAARTPAAARSPLTSINPVVTGGTASTTLTLTSTGAGALVLGDRQPVVGADAGYFAVTADGCAGQTLAPAATCDVTVQVSGTFAGSNARALIPFAANTAGGKVWMSVVATRADPPAPPTVLKAIDRTDGVALWWYPAAGNGVTYRISRALDGGGFTDIGTTLDASMRFADTTIPDGASATYRVAGVLGGVPGAWSETLDHTSARVPATPGGNDGFAYRSGTLAAYSSAPTVAAGPTSLSLTTTTPAGTSVSLDLTSTIGALSPGVHSAASGASGTPADVVVQASDVAYCDTSDATLTVQAWAFTAASVPVEVSADLLAPTCGVTASIRLHADTPAVAGVVADVDDVRVQDGAVGATAHRTITVSNHGGTPVTFAPPTVSTPFPQGTAPTIEASTCAGTLAPEASCTISLAWTPQVRGPSSALITLPVAGSTVPMAWQFIGAAAVAPTTTTTVSATISQVLLSANTTDNGGAELLSTRYYSGPDVDHLTLLAEVDGQAAAPPITDLAPGTTRVFVARGVNSVGEAAGTPVTVTVPTRQLVELHGLWGTTSAGLAVRAVDPSQEAQPLSTPGLTDIADLSLSPDRSFVVFSALAGGSTTGYDLYRRALTPNGVLIRLTSSSGDEIEPAISPDGTRVVFAQAVGPSISLREVPIAGGASTALLNGGGRRHPSWLPDGSAVVAESLTASQGLYRIPFTSAPTAIPGTAGAALPEVSPDGTTIAYTWPNPALPWPDSTPRLQLRTIPIAGGTPTTLTRSGPASDLVAPSWSPDSARIRVTVAQPTYDPALDSGIDVFSVTRNGLGGLGFQRESKADAYDEFDAIEMTSDSAAPSVALTVPAWTTATPSFAFTLDDADDRRGALRATCSIDGAAAAPCTSPFRPTGLAAGQHTLTVTAVDPVGSTGTSAGSFTVDTAAPVVAPLPATPRLLPTPTLTLRWAVSDAASGAGPTTVVYRLSTRSLPTAVTTAATSLTVAVPSGARLCWTVNARDLAGNLAPTPPQRCTTAPADDRSLKVAGSWAKLTGASYLNRTALRAAKAGATLTTRSAVSGRIVDVVVSTCPTCGTVEVRVGRTLLGRLSTKGKTASKVALTLRSSRLLKGVITLRASTGPVTIDGLAVSP